MKGPGLKRDLTDSLRVLIVDDEPPARELLRSMLEVESGISVVGESANGMEAVAHIRQLRPDLVFLDIQMPERDGFGVIEDVGIEEMPMVVFVTAYDQYALRAFDASATDYLLKPFDRDRLRRAIRRASERRRQNTPKALADDLRILLDQLRSRRAYPPRIGAKVDGKLILINVQDVDWIEAAGKVVQVHVGPRVHTVRETMNALELQLDPALFVRIHRSTIVNAERIREVQPWFQNDQLVILRDGSKLRAGRSYKSKLDALFRGA
jgi:two-component system LytT family response regulator